MTRVEDALLERLRDGDVALLPVTQASGPEAPWFVKLLLAIAGWLAAAFMLGFLALGVAPLIESSVASFGLGLLMLTAAYGLLRIPRNDFVEHLALTFSLVGQLLIAWVIVSILEGVAAGLWWSLLGLQALLALIMPNSVHRVFSAFAASLALHIALAESGAPYITAGLVLLALTWVWLNEFRWPRQLRRLQSLGYGLVLGLLAIQYLARFGQPWLDWGEPGGGTQGLAFDWLGPWVAEALSAVALLLLLRHLFQRSGHNAGGAISLGAYGGVVLLFLASLQAYGLTQGAVVLALGFAIGNRLLMGLGVVSLLFSVSSYYYLLDVTLLTKAQTLLLLGVLLLAMRWLLRRWLPITQESARA